MAPPTHQGVAVGAAPVVRQLEHRLERALVLGVQPGRHGDAGGWPLVAEGEGGRGPRRGAGGPRRGARVEGRAQGWVARSRRVGGGCAHEGPACLPRGDTGGLWKGAGALGAHDKRRKNEQRRDLACTPCAGAAPFPRPDYSPQSGPATAGPSDFGNAQATCANAVGPKKRCMGLVGLKRWRGPCASGNGDGH